MRGAQWVAVALAFAGLTLIVAPWDLTSLAGSLLAVAAGAVWAISAVLSKRWPTPGTDPLTFTAWQLFFGFFALAVLAARARRTSRSAGPPSSSGRSRSRPSFATAIGWWLWTYVLSHTPAGIAGLNALGIPVIAVLASWIQLGERPPPLELGGMVLIGVALGLLAVLGLRNGRPAPEGPAAPRRS